jgi:hypothetical protein
MAVRLTLRRSKREQGYRIARKKNPYFSKNIKRSGSSTWGDTRGLS